MSRATWYRHQLPKRRRLGGGSALLDGGGPADGGVDGPGDGDLGRAVELNAGNKRGGGSTDDGGVDVAGVPDVLDGGQGGGGDVVLCGDDVGGSGTLSGATAGACSSDEYDGEALDGFSGAGGDAVDPLANFDGSGSSTDGSSAEKELRFFNDDDDLHHDAVPPAAHAAAAVPVNKVSLTVDDFKRNIDDFVAYTFLCTHSMTRAATEAYLLQRSRYVQRKTLYKLSAFVNASVNFHER